MSTLQPRSEDMRAVVEAEILAWVTDLESRFEALARKLGYRYYPLDTGSAVVIERITEGALS